MLIITLLLFFKISTDHSQTYVTFFIQLKIYLSYNLTNSKTDIYLEIVPLKTKKGMCIYVNMKAFVLVPDIVVTIGLYQQPKQYADQEPAIGEVIASEEKPKMKEQEIGDGQAWYYPADK